MVALSPVFHPPVLKGIKVYANEPFRLDFILDKGDLAFAGEQAREASQKLIKYFLASLTIPEKDLWVNLSPYEKDRIIPDAFGLTEMGRDLLNQDYFLKQITASLIYPEGETGKKFWKEVYQKAHDIYGTTDIPVDTFNKVWITPDKAEVYENGKAGTAYVVGARLKVLLETDYLATAKTPLGAHVPSNGQSDISKDVMRQIIIPILEKEVNEGRNFAQLRQVYNSLILAAWYKKKITESLLSQVYVDQKKVQGVNIDDPQEAEKIWGQYVGAFKKGVFNFIKEERDSYSDEVIPRKYFSGGVDAAQISNILKMVSAAPSRTDPSMSVIGVDIKPSNSKWGFWIPGVRALRAPYDFRRRLEKLRPQAGRLDLLEINSLARELAGRPALMKVVQSTLGKASELREPLACVVKLAGEYGVVKGLRASQIKFARELLGKDRVGMVVPFLMDRLFAKKISADDLGKVLSTLVDKRDHRVLDVISALNQEGRQTDRDFQGSVLEALRGIPLAARQLVVPHLVERYAQASTDGRVDPLVIKNLSEVSGLSEEKVTALFSLIAAVGVGHYRPEAFAQWEEVAEPGIVNTVRELIREGGYLFMEWKHVPEKAVLQAIAQQRPAIIDGIKNIRQLHPGFIYQVVPGPEGTVYNPYEVYALKDGMAHLISEIEAVEGGRLKESLREGLLESFIPRKSVSPEDFQTLKGFFFTDVRSETWRDLFLDKKVLQAASLRPHMIPNLHMINEVLSGFWKGDKAFDRLKHAMIEDIFYSEDAEARIIYVRDILLGQRPYWEATVFFNELRLLPRLLKGVSVALPVPTQDGKGMKRFSEMDPVAKLEMYRAAVKDVLQRSMDPMEKQMAGRRNQVISGQEDLDIRGIKLTHVSSVNSMESVLKNGTVVIESLGAAPDRENITPFEVNVHVWGPTAAAGTKIISDDIPYGQKSGDVVQRGQVAYIYQPLPERWAGWREYYSTQDAVGFVLGGIPSTEVRGIVVKDIKDAEIVKANIVKQGFYIPVYDNDGKLVFSSADYQNFKELPGPVDVLSSDKPQDVINALKSMDPQIRFDLIRPALYSRVSGSSSLEGHELAVMQNFEDHFKDITLPEGVSVRLFRAVLALHDIAKPRAIDLQDKDAHHQEAEKIVRRALSSWGFSEREIQFAVALLAGDPVGDFMKLDESGFGPRPESEALQIAVRGIKGLAQQAGMPEKDFFQILTVFYTVDTGAYPYLRQKLFKEGAFKIDHPRFSLLEKAMGSTTDSAASSANTGGIDLNPQGMGLRTSGDQAIGIRFNFSLEEIERFKSAPGFVPVIINIEPLKSLPQFLGGTQVTSRDAAV